MTVFLSYSTPIRCDQQALLIAIEQIFKDQDVDVKTVENVYLQRIQFQQSLQHLETVIVCFA